MQKQQVGIGPPEQGGITREDLVEAPTALPRGGNLKRLHEMHGEGYSDRAIARELGLVRNTVLKPPRFPDQATPAMGIDVLLRELRSLGYEATVMIGYQFSASRFWGQANASAPPC